jgi:hypothetical protein
MAHFVQIALILFLFSSKCIAAEDRDNSDDFHIGAQAMLLVCKLTQLHKSLEKFEVQIREIKARYVMQNEARALDFVRINSLISTLSQSTEANINKLDPAKYFQKEDAIKGMKFAIKRSRSIKGIIGGIIRELPAFKDSRFVDRPTLAAAGEILLGIGICIQNTLDAQQLN